MPKGTTKEDTRPLETLVNDRTPLLSLSSPRRRSCRDFVDVTAIPTLIAVVVTASGEQVLRAVITSNLYHYRWFFVQLMCIWSVALASLAIAVRCLLFGKSLNFRAVPFKTLFFLAFLDMSHSLLLILPSGVVPFSLALLLPQFTIIFTMGLQRITSRKCPSIGYCIGTGLLLLAPVIAAGPCWETYQACPSTQDICGRSKSEILTNAGVLLLASLPAAGSGVYKHSLLSYTVVAPEVLIMLLSFIQLLMGFAVGPLALRLQYVAATPIYAVTPGADSWPTFNLTEGTFSDELSLLAPGPYRNNNDMFSNFVHGFSCLGGYNSEEGDICESLGYLVVLQVVLYVVCGVLLQHAMAQAMRQTQSDYAIAVALVIAMFVGLVVFALFWEDLLPAYQLALCEGKEVAILAGACAVLGLLCAQYGGFSPAGTVEVWARLEQAEQDLNFTPRGSESEFRYN